MRKRQIAGNPARATSQTGAARRSTGSPARRRRQDTDADFAMQLLKAHGVASIPTSAFLYNSDAPRVLRFCFAKKDETLERAAERLRRV
jgi:aspartate/methionine/tyrosine aminotransferase